MVLKNCGTDFEMEAISLSLYFLLGHADHYILKSYTNTLFVTKCFLVHRNSLTRRHMVLKTLTYTNLLDDGSKWEKFGEKNIFGYIFTR